MDMSLGVPTEYHLRMKVIQQPLHFANTIAELYRSIAPVISNKVEELGVQIIETLDATHSGSSEGDESTGGESILSRTLVERRLVIVGQVEQECVRDGALERSDETGSRGTLGEGRGDVGGRSEACSVHGAYVFAVSQGVQCRHSSRSTYRLVCPNHTDTTAD